LSSIESNDFHFEIISVGAMGFWAFHFMLQPVTIS